MLVAIREKDCIGCTKCIKACPVDAILGSANLMHTVIANECIGCELCVPACPVDCIELVDGIIPSKNKELTLKRAKARKQRLSAPTEADNSPDEIHSISSELRINQTLARIKELKEKRFPPTRE